MQLCHLAHNQLRERGSLLQSTAAKSPQPNEPKLRACPKSLSIRSMRPIPALAALMPPTPHRRNPKNEPTDWNTDRIPMNSRATRRKRVIQLQYLHYLSFLIRILQLSIVTPPLSVLIIVLGLRRLS